MSKKKVTLSLDAKTYGDFQKYCDDNAIMLSKKIELFMKSLLDSKRGKSFVYFAIAFLVLFASQVSAASIFSDGFESGGLTNWNLSNAAGANNWSAVVTDPFQGTIHAQSMPSSTTEPASIMSRNISTLGYQSINFSYHRKLVGIDAADEFIVKWYNGTNWTILEQTGAVAADDLAYVFRSFLLPSTADSNPNFQIRFECTAGAVTEFCRVDNVNLTGDAIDSTAPSVYLKSPPHNTRVGNKTANVVYFVANFTDNVGLVNVTLRLWNSTADEVGINFTSIKGVANFTNLSLVLPYPGSFFWNYFATDNASNTGSDFTNGPFTIVLDVIPPVFSNFIESPLNGSNYSLGQIYRFNITITDSSGVSNALINFNGLNYTAPNRSSVWYFNISGLAAGVYNYTWHANDSLNNYNLSAVRFYTINKAVSQVNLTINNSENNITLQQNSVILLNGTRISGEEGSLELYLNGSLINQGSVEVSNFTNFSSLGLFNITVLYVTSQNYTSSYKTYYVNVTPAPDVTPPSLTINSPVNQTYSTNNISVDITSDGSSVWFYNGTANETYTSPVYRIFSQGSNVLFAYANDSAGNLNNTSVTFFVDSLVPLIDYGTGTETNGATVNRANVVINVTSTDTNFRNVTINLFNSTGLVNSTVWASSPAYVNITNLLDGNYTFNATALDVLANTNNTQTYTITVRSDVTAPNLVISYPGNLTYTIVQAALNYSASDSALASCWYSTNGGTTNVSITCGNNVTGLDSGQGSSIWTVWANDTTGNTNSSSVTFFVDSLIPTIDFVSPSDANSSNFTRKNIVVNISSFDSNFANLTISLFNSTDLVNSTFSNLPNLYLNFTSLSDGLYVFNASVVDLFGNLNHSESRSVTIYSDIIPVVGINLTYPLNLSYTSVQTLLNYTILSGVPSSCWYSLNGGTTNVSITCGNNVTGLDSGQGSSTWTIYANNSEGVESYSSVTFFVNSSSNSTSNRVPYIIFNSPLNNSVLNSRSVILNLSVYDDDLDLMNVSIFGDGALLLNAQNQVNGSNLTYNWSSLATGSHNWTAIAFDGKNYSTLSHVYFSVNITSLAPEVYLSRPSLCAVFGYNQSIALNLSVISNNTDKCWYSLNGGTTNVSLNSCQNSTFNVSGNGDYTLTVYANESINGFVGSRSANFKVDLQSPTLFVSRPKNNTAVNYSFVEFNYFTEGNSTDVVNQCRLYGDFTGNYSLNMTNNSVVNGAYNSFFVNLTEGLYSWNVGCSTPSRNVQLTCNYSLISDVTPPEVDLTEPSGVYSSNVVPITFVVVDALSGVDSNSCTYSVNLSSNNSVLLSGSAPGCTNGVVSIGQDGSFVLTLRANDNAGNSRGSSANFAIDSSSSSGGGGGGSGTPGVSGFAELNASIPSDIYLKRSQSTSIVVAVKNTGQRFLNRCGISFSGALSKYASNEEISSLSSGEIHDYSIQVNLDSSLIPGQYILEAKVQCDEASFNMPIPLVIIPTDFDFRFLRSARDVDELSVFYSIEELAGKNQNLNIEYRLVNSFGVDVAQGIELTSLVSLEKKDSSFLIKLPKDSFGEFDLVLTVSNGVESLEFENPIFLSSRSITGLAISDANKKALSILSVIIVCLVLFFIILRFIHRRKNLAHYHPPIHSHIKHHVHHKSVHHGHHRK